MSRILMLRIAALTALLAVAIALLGRVQRATEPSLLTGARRAAPVSSWNLKHADYTWLTNDQVLFFRGSPFAPRTGWRFYRHDLRTGQEEELAGLTKLFRMSWGLSPHWVNISPDGSRVMWPCQKGVIGATLDGKRHFKAAIRQAVYCYWLSDGRHWVELRLRTVMQGRAISGAQLVGAVVRDCSTGGIVRAISLNTPVDYTGQYRITQKDLGITEDRSGAARSLPASVVNPAGLTAPPAQPNTIKTVVLDLSAGGVKPQTLEIRLPQDLWYPTRAVYSPNGQRAAFLALQQEPMPAVMPFWFRFFPTLYRQRPPLASLWVCGLQGQGLRRIAYENYRIPAPGKTIWEGIPQMLCWLPDGKTLSFVHDGFLWTVKAD